jgi:hypothetical protein
VTPSLLDALGCPYCGAVLFKESYYVRCERDHRFRSSLQRERVASGRSGPRETGNALEVRSIQLRVIWHADRQEIGRLFVFPLVDGEGP